LHARRVDMAHEVFVLAANGAGFSRVGHGCKFKPPAESQLPQGARLLPCTLAFHPQFSNKKHVQPTHLRVIS
jgi:hypothetical protein